MQTTNKPLCSISLNRHERMVCWLSPWLKCLVVLFIDLHPLDGYKEFSLPLFIVYPTHDTTTRNGKNKWDVVWKNIFLLVPLRYGRMVLFDVSIIPRKWPISAMCKTYYSPRVLYWSSFPSVPTQRNLSLFITIKTYFGKCINMNINPPINSFKCTSN
jgi:hypothetical protein